MSSLIETTALRHGDLFELPNGSVYAVEHHAATLATPQARLWCAHPPEPNSSHPPLTELPTGPVQLLTDRHEISAHVHHAGYVKHVFVAEMNRRHQVQMSRVYTTMQHTAEAARQQANARTWWKKLIAYITPVLA